MCTKSEVKTKNGALEDMKTVQYCWPREPEEREGLGGAGEREMFTAQAFLCSPFSLHLRLPESSSRNTSFPPTHPLFSGQVVEI